MVQKKIGKSSKEDAYLGLENGTYKMSHMRTFLRQSCPKERAQHCDAVNGEELADRRRPWIALDDRRVTSFEQLLYVYITALYWTPSGVSVDYSH
jgi:hypothetical protein